MLFDETLKKGKKYDTLLTPRDFTKDFKYFILPTVCQLSKRLFEEHLPGGKLSNLIQETAHALKRCLKHPDLLRVYLDS